MTLAAPALAPVLLPVSGSPDFLQTTLDRGWLEDPETNRHMGFGSNGDGIGTATHHFMRAFDNGLLGIFFDTTPVGWLSVSPDGDGAALLTVYVDAAYRRHNYGRTAVVSSATSLLADGYRRVGASVPEINAPARSFFRACGFRREGKRWNALLIDGRVYDTENLVLTQAEIERTGRKPEGGR